jgi:hypothetical protein
VSEWDPLRNNAAWNAMLERTIIANGTCPPVEEILARCRAERKPVSQEIRCGRCKQSKPPEAFNESIQRKGSGYCKDCIRLYTRRWRERTEQRAAEIRSVGQEPLQDAGPEPGACVTIMGKKCCAFCRSLNVKDGMCGHCNRAVAA